MKRTITLGLLAALASGCGGDNSEKPEENNPVVIEFHNTNTSSHTANTATNTAGNAPALERGPVLFNPTREHPLESDIRAELEYRGMRDAELQELLHDPSYVNAILRRMPQGSKGMSERAIDVREQHTWYGLVEHDGNTYVLLANKSKDDLFHTFRPIGGEVEKILKELSDLGDFAPEPLPELPGDVARQIDNEWRAYFDNIVELAQSDRQYGREINTELVRRASNVLNTSGSIRSEYLRAMHGFDERESLLAIRKLALMSLPSYGFDANRDGQDVVRDIETVTAAQFREEIQAIARSLEHEWSQDLPWALVEQGILPRWEYEAQAGARAWLASCYEELLNPEDTDELIEDKLLVDQLTYRWMGELNVPFPVSVLDPLLARVAGNEGLNRTGGMGFRAMGVPTWPVAGEHVEGGGNHSFLVSVLLQEEDSLGRIHLTYTHNPGEAMDEHGRIRIHQFNPLQDRRVDGVNIWGPAYAKLWSNEWTSEGLRQFDSTNYVTKTDDVTPIQDQGYAGQVVDLVVFKGAIQLPENVDMNNAIHYTQLPVTTIDRTVADADGRVSFNLGIVPPHTQTNSRGQEISDGWLAATYMHGNRQRGIIGMPFRVMPNGSTEDVVPFENTGTVPIAGFDQDKSYDLYVWFKSDSGAQGIAPAGKNLRPQNGRFGLPDLDDTLYFIAEAGSRRLIPFVYDDGRFWKHGPADFWEPTRDEEPY